MFMIMRTGIIIPIMVTTTMTEKKNMPLRGKGERKRSDRVIPEQAEAGAPRNDEAALYRLMAWLSPSYPVGAFSYSSGIEWAVACA